MLLTDAVRTNLKQVMLAYFQVGSVLLDVKDGGLYPEYTTGLKNSMFTESELFINPLMTLYFAFDLAAVAAASLYLPLLEGTRSIFEVQARIEGFRKGVAIRPRRTIPH